MFNKQIPTPIVPPNGNKFYFPSGFFQTLHDAPHAYFNPTEDSTTKERTDIISHQVKDGDTLVSLSLDYGVSSIAIKKFNWLTSDDIYYLKVILIPDPKKTVDPTSREEEEKQRKITLRQAFKNRTGETVEQIVTEYLTKSSFKFDFAVDLYEKDKNIIEKKKEPINKLKNMFLSRDKDDSLAEEYLNMCNWDFDTALREYNQDLDQGSQVVRRTVLANKKENFQANTSSKKITARPLKENRFSIEEEEDRHKLILRNDVGELQSSGTNHHDRERFKFEVSKKEK